MRMLAFGVGALIVAGWLGGWADKREPSATAAVDDDSQVRRVLSTDLFSAYHENAVAADAAYRAPLIVEGKVKDIGKDISGVAYLILGDRDDVMQGVQVLFDRGDSALAALSRGDRVAVRCERNRGHVVNVILRTCSLVH